MYSILYPTWINLSGPYIVWLSLFCFFFLIAGENIAATAVSGSEIQVTWDQPAYIYVELNVSAGASPSLNGSV